MHHDRRRSYSSHDANILLNVVLVAAWSSGDHRAVKVIWVNLLAVWSLNNQIWRPCERHAIMMLPIFLIIFVLHMSAVFPQMSAFPKNLKCLVFTNGEHAHRAFTGQSQGSKKALTPLTTFKKSDHRALTPLPWRVFFLIWRVFFLKWAPCERPMSAHGATTRKTAKC